MRLASIPYISRIQDSDNFIYLPAVSTGMVFALVWHQVWGKKEKKSSMEDGGEKATRKRH